MVRLGRRVLDVDRRDRAFAYHLPAGLDGPEAEVGVLEVGEQLLVEETHRVEAVTADVGLGEDDRLDRAGGVALVDVELLEAAHLLAHEGEGHHEGAQVQDRPLAVDQAGPDHTPVGLGVGRVLELGQPLTVGDEDVVVHEHDVLARPADGDAGVATLGEAQVAVVAHEGDPGEGLQPLGGTVDAAVVDDDQAPARVVGELLEGGQAPLGEPHGVPGEDDDRHRARWRLDAHPTPSSSARRALSSSTWLRRRSFCSRTFSIRSSTSWLNLVCCTHGGDAYHRRPRRTARLPKRIAVPMTGRSDPEWNSTSTVAVPRKRGDPHLVVALDGHDEGSLGAYPPRSAGGADEGRLHPRHHHRDRCATHRRSVVRPGRQGQRRAGSGRAGTIRAEGASAASC